ncbi:hypothetical protein L7F22_064892 [Adiantum nelumboides]|nr:hypothetical protein [Adiantum nelumboides]
MRELKEPGTSYDGPKKAKKIDLAEAREEPKSAYIAIDLAEEEEQLLIATLKQYRDVFVWSYKDVFVFVWSYKELKGVDPSICQHTIPLKSDAKPSRQRLYTYNETFARKIKKEIDKLKETEFIYEIEHMDWVSPIVVVPKKNGKLRVCVNLKKRKKELLLLALTIALIPMGAEVPYFDPPVQNRALSSSATVQRTIDMADGASGRKYTLKIPKYVYDHQMYYQSMVGKNTHMKGPLDKIFSFIVPVAIASTVAAMMGRGLWNLSHGTGKKE